MVFSGFPFLLWFLPFFLAAYYFAPQQAKNAVLLLFSLVFYGYGCLEHPLYFVLLLVSVLVNYLLGCGLGRGKGKRLLLALGLLYNFGILFVFKYLDFTLESVERLAARLPFGALTLPRTDWVLPIGISFFTFQIVSYLIDVYRGDAPAEKNLIRLGTYIIAFPQLIAGPIVKYNEIRLQLHERTVTKACVIEGAEKFILGLGLKVLLANRLAGLWTEVAKIGAHSLSVPMAWMGILGYSLQLYFDFYGYSLMAIGLGKLMGFDYPENFREPYTATSMTDFWRRWHITLGGWFRDYVYIPLGGNRKGKGRTYCNLFLVWLLTGIWHGAGVNFLLWGLFLAVIIVLEKAFYGKFLARHALLGHLYMLVLIPLSWLLFALEDLQEIGAYLGRLVGLGGEYVFAGDWIKNLKLYWPFLLAGVLLSTTLGRRLYEKFRGRWIMIPVLLAVLAAIFYCLYRGLNDPFMYFRF